MIRFKEVAILYIELLLQINLVQTQWNNGYADYGSYYAPNPQESGSSFLTSGPIYYVPVQGPAPLNFVPTYQTTNTAASYEQNPSNGIYPPFNTPVYSNTPTVSYQGLDEANALRSAYPNQPIIIINNGGNGDTGGNSNNGNNNGKRGDGFNFGDLAAILLASHRGHGHKGLGGELAPEPGPTIAPPAACAPVAQDIGVNPAFNNNNAGRREETGGNNKYSTVTHITIILPSSGTVTVEEKKKKREKNTEKEQRKEGRAVEEKNRKKEKNTEKEQKKEGGDKGNDKEKEIQDFDNDEEENVMHSDNFEEDEDEEIINDDSDEQ